jgi:uncharacterized RDD family membrane protein YckC
MAAAQENISKLLSILSHPLRREILIYIGENGEQSFTDLMNALNVDTGKMSFHMRSLRELLEQNSSGKYQLSKVGEKALRIVGELEEWYFTGELEPKETVFSVATFTNRSIAFFLDLSITFIVFMLPTIVTDLFLARIENGIRLEFNIFLFLALLWMYLTLLEGFSGQTLGKLAMRLKVVRVDDKPIFYDNAAIRNLGECFLLPLDLLAGYQLKSKRFLRYFDKLAGTMVIDLRIRRKNS